MKHRSGYFLILLVAFISCQDIKRPEMPDNLIDKSTMIEVLSESYLMNAARSVANRDVKSKGIKLDSIIYAKYAIDSLQFAQSNAFYSADVDVYKELFLEVQKNLVAEKTLRDSLYAIYKKTQKAIKTQDSINKVQLDSLRIEFPKISKDSLQKRLELLRELEVEKVNVGIDVEPAESDQDSNL